ncbi:hypothetical protein BY996DRAFT_1320757 [Phakopsora pachyrhizi]|nr:hypothetical protein BY996DRAFT_1320757 [Phakopsora pachyrhizi]
MFLRAYNRRSDSFRLEKSITILIEEPSGSSIMKLVYAILSILGLVYTAFLYISFQLGKRKKKKHPVVNMYIFWAMLNFFNNLLPWFFNVWEIAYPQPKLEMRAAKSSIVFETVRCFACSTSGIFQSYFRIIMASFIAVFAGEAFRIVIKTWNITSSERFRRGSVAGEDEAVAFGRDNISYLNLRQEVSRTSYDHEAGNKIYGEQWLHCRSTIPNYNHKKSQAIKPQRNANFFRSILAPNVLCYIPLFCGMPSLILTLVQFISSNNKIVYLNNTGCRYDSKTVILVEDIILGAALAMTIIYSILGFVIKAMIRAVLLDGYEWTIQFFMVISPIVAAVVLTDIECFAVWGDWFKLFFRPKVVRRKNRHRQPRCSASEIPCVKASRPSFGLQYSRRNNSRRSWAPPKPSYSRAHRPISMCIEEDFETEIRHQFRLSRPHSKFYSRFSRRFNYTRKSSYSIFQRPGSLTSRSADSSSKAFGGQESFSKRNFQLLFPNRRTSSSSSQRRLIGRSQSSSRRESLDSQCDSNISSLVVQLNAEELQVKTPVEVYMVMNDWKIQSLEAIHSPDCRTISSQASSSNLIYPKNFYMLHDPDPFTESEARLTLKLEKPAKSINRARKSSLYERLNKYNI